MKLAVVCANGKAGKLIVKEALDRGLDVTLVVRGENRTQARQVLQKDLYDLTAEDLKDFDVVVDAFGAWTEESLPGHSTSLAHLCDILSGTQTRLLVVGGAGSLYVNPEHTVCVADGPDFPDAFKPLAAAMAGLARYTSESTCPIRPTKFLFVVEMQRSPSARIPIYPPRHGPQVGVLTTAPASIKIFKSPSSIACR